MFAKGIENQLTLRHSQSFLEGMGGVESRGRR
jgi:hypothetical protein